MSTLPAREFRHNLRTPINHILGYGELLLEDARESDRGELVGDLEQILAAAREALAAIDRADSPAEVRERVRGPAERIAVLARELAARSGGAGADDLEKIRNAAGALMEMVGQAAPAPAEGQARDAVEREPQAASGARARLLVVDDNETNRHVLRRRLERQGHAVEEAADGRRALALLRSGAFDLVLLDIVMPVMDGFEVLAEMKADAALAEVPVIVISALDEMSSVVRAIEMGAADYLSKPFDPVLLRARIAASLETRRLRNELVVREKLASLGELTAGVAHEIKNPLNFVNNFADLALELVGELREKLAPLGDGEALELAGDLERNVAKIKEHGMRADSVVRSMLLHARTGAGERRATEVNALVDESVRLAWHGARAQDPSAGIAIETDYDPEAGEARVAPQDLSRVILNITANALYAVRGRPGAVIRAATRNLGRKVEIRIRDNGPGIPREHLGRIFDPFFTTKPAGEGTGLGLSLAYDIVVRGHQGEIRVESEEGRGAEFIVTLPRE